MKSRYIANYYLAMSIVAIAVFRYIIVWMRLTKSQFLTYLESPLHLWLSVHGTTPPKPPSVYDQHVMKQGYSVEKLAKQFLERKVASEYPAGTTLEFEVVL